MKTNQADRYEEYADRLLKQVKGLRKELADSERSPVAAGKICELMNNLSEALQIYERLAVKEDCSSEALARLAIVQIKLGNPRDALATAVRLVERGDDRLQTLIGTPLAARTILGDALLQTGQVDAALDAYREALNAEPDDRRAGSQLVQLLFERGKLEEAREAAEKVEFEPGRQPLRALLGLIKEDGTSRPAVLGIRSMSIRAEHAV